MTQRLHGSLDGLTDSEQRPLRPIGMSVREVASRTGNLLSRLIDIPGVRLFAGVRVAAHVPPIAFAISAGSQVLLVESVAWPSGAYSTAPDGGVLCDGTYIGQSVQPLLGSVRRLRRVLPRHHRVGAVVVVHPCGSGLVALPETASSELTWLPSGDVTGHIGRQLRRGRAGVRPFVALTDHLLAP
jgi:hypothetical protein